MKQSSKSLKLLLPTTTTTSTTSSSKFIAAILAVLAALTMAPATKTTTRAFLNGPFMKGWNRTSKASLHRQKRSASTLTSQESASSSASSTVSSRSSTTRTAAAAAAAKFENLLEEKNIAAPEKLRRVHLVVLVHGWMGNSLELGYLGDALERESDRILRLVQQPPGGGNVGDGDTDAGSNGKNTLFFVHSATSNQKKTFDGIAAGGTRLAEEVMSLIDSVSERVGMNVKDGQQRQGGNDEDNSVITLSFVGNSLGGLYARYALSKIPYLHNDDDEDGTSPGSSTIRVQPKVFCTTATPHLGVSENTWLPVPRAAEYAIANTLKPTGRDLFRYTDVIDRMAIDGEFVGPLGRFEKRLAYANAHATDFQVPTATAAFLAETDSVHRKVTMPPRIPSNAPTGVPFVSLVVETVPQRDDKGVSADDDGDNVDGSGDGGLSLKQIASRLDALGWTKVFTDVRETLFSVPIPFKWGVENAERDHDAQEEFTSKELLRRYGGGVFSDDRIYFPFGHSVMVANSKSEWYGKFNKAGRPIMDQLAADLVADIVHESNGER